MGGLAYVFGCVMSVGYLLGGLWVLYNAWMISALAYSAAFPYADDQGFWAFAFRVVVTMVTAWLMWMLISVLSALSSAIFSGGGRR